VREFAGEVHKVTVTTDGFYWQGATYRAFPTVLEGALLHGVTLTRLTEAPISWEEQQQIFASSQIGQDKEGELSAVICPPTVQIPLATVRFS